MSHIAPLDYGFAGESNYGRYYRHSGQIRVGGVVATLVVGLLAGCVMAGVYSATIVFIPFVKLRGIACFFYGIGLGFIPGLLLKRFKVRNLQVSLAVVGVIALISYYFSWASWETFVLRHATPTVSFLRIVERPQLVYNIAKVANEVGTWSMSGAEPVSGPALLGIWIVEAVIIFGAALLTVRSVLRDLPFCEKCDRWSDGPKTVRLTAPTDVNVLKSKLEAGDFAFVATLPEPTGAQRMTFMHHQCSQCRELNTLSVVLRVIRKDKRGRVRSNKAKTVVDKLWVKPDDIQKMIPPGPHVIETAPLPSGAVPATPVPVAATVRRPIKSPQAL